MPEKMVWLTPLIMRTSRCGIQDFRIDFRLISGKAPSEGFSKFRRSMADYAECDKGFFLTEIMRRGFNRPLFGRKFKRVN